MDSLYICRARYKVSDASTNNKEKSKSKMFAIGANKYSLAESTTITYAQRESGFVAGSAWVSAIKRRNLTGFDSFSYVVNNGITTKLVSIPNGNYLYELYTRITRADNSVYVVSVFVVSDTEENAKETIRGKILADTAYSSVTFDGHRLVL